MRNYTRDEGGPFWFGNQVLISSHRKLLRLKAMVVRVAETPGEIPAGTVERGERASRPRSADTLRLFTGLLRRESPARPTSHKV